jgi:hypothetical protein
VGRPEAAAFGLQEYLSIPDDELADFLRNKERAIEREFTDNPLAVNLYEKYPEAATRDRINYEYVAKQRAERKIVTGNAGMEEEQDAG